MSNSHKAIVAGGELSASISKKISLELAKKKKKAIALREEKKK